MRDAVALQGQTIIINNVSYTINEIYFVPGTNFIYIGLIDSEKNHMNYRLEELLPHIIKQIRL